MAVFCLVILYSRLVDKVSRYTWIAIGLVVLEGLTLLLFRLSCPLMVLARRYSDSNQPNFDTFLPNWLARSNKRLFAWLYIVSLRVVLYRQTH